MVDGAPTNRSLIQEVRRQFGCFTTPNPIKPGSYITYIMDPKVRNNPLNSSNVCTGDMHNICCIKLPAHIRTSAGQEICYTQTYI